MNWRDHAKQLIKDMPEGIKDIRNCCKNDFRTFARTINHGYLYGYIHMSVYKEMVDYELLGQC